MSKTLSTTPCYVPINFADYTIGKELSVPIVSDSGMVHQCFTFDLKTFDETRYKILKPTTDSYLLSKEEVVRLLGDAWGKAIDHLDNIEKNPVGFESNGKSISLKEYLKSLGL